MREKSAIFKLIQTNVITRSNYASIERVKMARDNGHMRLAPGLEGTAIPNRARRLNATAKGPKVAVWGQRPGSRPVSRNRSHRGLMYGKMLASGCEENAQFFATDALTATWTP